MKKAALIFLFLICSCTHVLAQNVGYADYHALSNNDTLRLMRVIGDFRFGVLAGLNTNFYFGNLNVPQNPKNSIDTSKDSQNLLLPFNRDYGLSAFVGGKVEWVPPDSKIGIMLYVYLLDFLYNSSDVKTNPDPDNGYTAVMTYSYLTLSPSVRYNIVGQGLFLIGGIDAAINLKKTAVLNRKQNNDNAFTSHYNFGANPQPVRLGAHLGIGTDILILDVNDRTNVYLTPFITVNAGTDIFKGYSSTLNGVNVKLGFSIGFRNDKVHRDTIPFNKDYIPPQINVAGNKTTVNPLVLNNSVNQPPQTELKQINVPDTTAIAKLDSSKITPATPKIPENFAPTQTKLFEYTTPAATSLSTQMTEYLNLIVDYLKNNPSYNIRIVGHSDNQGTFQQNQQRSEERAKAVVRFLMSKGIPRGRIYDRGDGSRYPLGDNRTEAGRMANRRVEIQVVK